MSAELSWYRGYKLIISDRCIEVIAPNGDRARFQAMSSVRAWVRRGHRRMAP